MKWAWKNKQIDDLFTKEQKDEWMHAWNIDVAKISVRPTSSWFKIDLNFVPLAKNVTLTGSSASFEK